MAEGAVGQGSCPTVLNLSSLTVRDHYSNPGEMAYLAAYLSSPSEYVCAFNIDRGGRKGTMDFAYSFYECPEQLTKAPVFPVLQRPEGFKQNRTGGRRRPYLVFFFRRSRNLHYLRRNYLRWRTACSTQKTTPLELIDSKRGWKRWLSSCFILFKENIKESGLRAGLRTGTPIPAEIKPAALRLPIQG